MELVICFAAVAAFIGIVTAIIKSFDPPKGNR